MTSSKTDKPTTEPSDVTDWKALVIWARKNGVMIHELTVGSVRGVITDSAPTAQPVKKTDQEARDGLYAHYGGELLESAILETSKDAGDDGDDEED